MTTYTDTFDRANGPLGADWVTGYGAPSISNNAVVGTTRALADCVAFNAPGYQRVQATFAPSGAQNTEGMVGVKTASTGTSGYWAGFHKYSDHTSWGFWTIVGGTLQTVHVSNLSHGLPNPSVIEVIYEDNHYKATLNGGDLVEFDSSNYAAQTRAGIGTFSNLCPVLSFTAYDIGAMSITISPNLVSAYGYNTILEVTGYGTDWTVSPPSTTFTCNNGTINAQQVINATSALLYWTPPLSAYETTTFTESQYGLTATVDSDAELPSTYGQGYQLTPEASNLLTRTGLYCPGGRVLTTCENVDPPNEVKITDALNAILEQLGGFPNQVGPDIGAVSLPSEIYELHKKVGEEGYWTLAEVIALLGGAPVVYSNKDIIDAIGAGIPTDLQPVLDAIAAVRGEGNPDIAAVMAQLAAIRTASNYTLGSIIAAISGIPPTSLQPVLDRLDDIQPNTAYDLTTITTAIVNLRAVADSIAASLAAYRTVSNYTVQSILDAIAGLSVTVNAPPVVGVPGQVRTYSETINYTEPMHVCVACDGFTYTIPSHSEGVKGYQVGDRYMVTGGGGYAFLDENGDAEPLQFCNSENGIALPRTMAHASGFLWSPNIRATGQLKPFTLS